MHENKGGNTFLFILGGLDYVVLKKCYIICRKVVPTLTSDERRGLSHNGRC
jgi:hypothetical protein